MPLVTMMSAAPPLQSPQSDQADPQLGVETDQPGVSADLAWPASVCVWSELS